MIEGIFQSTKLIDGFSTCFRQWRATHSHCRFLHGYSLSFKVWFQGEPDCRGWVQDFGSFKRNGIKDSLSYYFDHTAVVAQDDPHIGDFKLLHKEQVLTLRVLPNVGSEKFAEFVFQLIDTVVKIESKGRVSVLKVECFEHEKNSSIFSGTSSLTFNQCSCCSLWKISSDFYHRTHSKCKECTKLHYKESGKEKERALDRAKRRYELHKEEVIETSQNWYQKNKTRANQLAKKNRKKRYSNSAIEKLKHNTRSVIHSALTKQQTVKSGRTHLLLGCSIEQLKLHLEERFAEGMNWDNYGEWHVDHIKPCAAFDLTDPEQQRICFHYTNLQPLWGKDNISKGSFHEGKRHKH